jgi:hypothetical protein
MVRRRLRAGDNSDPYADDDYADDSQASVEIKFERSQARRAVR